MCIQLIVTIFDYSLSNHVALDATAIDCCYCSLHWPSTTTTHKSSSTIWYGQCSACNFIKSAAATTAETTSSRCDSLLVGWLSASSYDCVDAIVNSAVGFIIVDWVQRLGSASYIAATAVFVN